MEKNASPSKSNFYNLLHLAIHAPPPAAEPEKSELESESETVDYLLAAEG